MSGLNGNALNLPRRSVALYECTYKCVGAGEMQERERGTETQRAFVVIMLIFMCTRARERER